MCSEGLLVGSGFSVDCLRLDDAYGPACIIAFSVLDGADSAENLVEMEDVKENIFSLPHKQISCLDMSPWPIRGRENVYHQLHARHVERHVGEERPEVRDRFHGDA